MSERKRKQAEQKNDHGKILCGLGQYGNAKVFFTDAIELNPDEAKYWYNRSACNLTMGFYVQALYDSRKSITLDPSYINGYKRFSKCCKLLDDLETAKGALEKAMLINSSEEELKSELKFVEELLEIDESVKNNLKNKNYEELLSDIEKYLSVLPQSKKYILLKVECLVRLQKFTDANQVLLPFENSDDEDFLYMKGLCNFYNGYIRQTFPYLKQVKAKIPDHHRLSDLYRKAKKMLNFLELIEDSIANDKPIEAYVWYSEALEVDPDNTITNQLLFYNKISIGMKSPDLIKKVISDCTNYLQNYNNDIKVLKIRAKCYMEMQEYEDAMEDYGEIMKIEETEENKKLYQKASDCFMEQSSDDYKVLKIDKNEFDERKIDEAYRKLLLKYDNQNENKQKNMQRIKIAYHNIIRQIQSEYPVREPGYSCEYPVRQTQYQTQHTIKDAQTFLNQHKFDKANEILDEVIKSNPNDDKAIYTKALCIFYGDNILKTFKKLGEFKNKIPANIKMNELYSKAEKTFELVNEIEDALKNNEKNKAHNLINLALNIDPKNITTNKYLHLRKIQLVSNDPESEQNMYNLCTAYLTTFGPDLAVLKTRAKFSFEAAEYEDAMEDYEELLKMEKNEENERFYKEASRLYKEENESDAKTLKIAENETNPANIKSAFLELILLYHPDKNIGVTEDRKKKLEKKLIRVKKAYSNLENRFK